MAGCAENSAHPLAKPCRPCLTVGLAVRPKAPPDRVVPIVAAFLPSGSRTCPSRSRRVTSPTTSPPVVGVPPEPP
ncbi:hypothetical protein, partial [Enterobacter hormaechei]|uniref:hypothetical protein n=1 Tax=Enterobacter hormaechei TaxID=158836 RepID=UPI00203E21B8